MLTSMPLPPSPLCTALAFICLCVDGGALPQNLKVKDEGREVSYVTEYRVHTLALLWYAIAMDTFIMADAPQLALLTV